MQTLIRLLLEGQSDQGLHCLPNVASSYFEPIRILIYVKLIMWHSAGQVKIVGDKLLLSSSCPLDKLSSLAYF